MAQETVLRATLQVKTLDINTRESDLALTWADLVHKHRHFLVTGYRYDPTSGSLMSESGRGNTPLRVLARGPSSSYRRALISRSYTAIAISTSLKPTNHLIYDWLDSIYVTVLETLTHATNATWRTATQLDQDLRISKPDRNRPTEGKGPLDKWKAVRVTLGLFTRNEGKIIYNLASTCAGISHCASNTVPVCALSPFSGYGQTHTSASY